MGTTREHKQRRTCETYEQIHHKYILPTRNKNKGSRNTYDQWSKIITVEIGNKNYGNEFAVTKEWVCILNCWQNDQQKAKDSMSKT